MARRGHRVVSTNSAESALRTLSQQWFPLIFLDLGLPGMGGLEFCRKVRSLEDGDLVYIIVGTGETGSEKLAEILRAGADDYIAKPYLRGLLEVRLAVAEKHVRQIEQRAKLEKELLFLAKHDPLTRLWNRWQLNEVITRALQQNQEENVEGSLLLLDLDHFKDVNDTCGHQVGDQLLQTVASSLQQNFPTDSWLIRFGGDEFVAVLPRTPVFAAVEKARRVAEQISQIDFPNLPDVVRPSCSIGITALHHNCSTQELLKEADMACYRAKSLGKNRVEVYVRFDEALLEPKPVVRKIKKPEAEIVENDDLELWFQPVCNLQNGQIFYQEALMRFVSARTKNPIQASLFMSQLTDHSNSRALDRFVIHEIIHHLVKNPTLVASVNISAMSVTEWAFAELIIQLLDKYQIAPGRLFLEITETHSISDLSLAKTILNRLSNRGVQCMLDDLGAGFSSIVILKSLPIQIVKIDGSLIEDSHQEGFNRVFLDALEVFSRGVGFVTVAERIETIEELQTARTHGIQFGQGYLIAKPRKVPYQNHEIPVELFQNSTN